MNTYYETVEVKDGRHTRAVKVTITAPEGRSVLNLQDLAQRAWDSPGKSVTEDGVTVKVKKFSR